MENRWTRLEQYARWRQRRLRIDRLPPDVLSLLCTFLEYVDVCRLVEAINGHAPIIRCKCDMVDIPIEFRHSWMRETAYDILETRVRSLANEACYFSRSFSVCVHAYADWSPFKKQRWSPQPLAEFMWRLNDTGRPTWCTVVNRRAIQDQVCHMIRHSLCATRVAMYVAMEIQRYGMIIAPKEVSASLVLVFPHFIN